LQDPDDCRHLEDENSTTIKVQGNSTKQQSRVVFKKKSWANLLALPMVSWIEGGQYM
jgi:hypothetical protein